MSILQTCICTQRPKSYAHIIMTLCESSFLWFLSIGTKTSTFTYLRATLPSPHTGELLGVEYLFHQNGIRFEGEGKAQPSLLLWERNCFNTAHRVALWDRECWEWYRASDKHILIGIFIASLMGLNIHPVFNRWIHVSYVSFLVINSAGWRG